MSGLTREILTADVVYTGIGTARSNGAVVVQSAGGRETIADVTDLESARRIWSDAPVRHVGFAISPAVVNAHTHLDLTDMPLVNDHYEVFIPTVIAFASSGKRTLEAARRGTEEMIASGVRKVGDIVTVPEVMRYLLEHPGLTGVAYWEVISPDPADAAADLARTEAELKEFLTHQRPGGVRVGLTPHTPHTVSGELLQGLARLARRLGVPLQIHVAESPLELAMHQRGEGELADVRRSFDPGFEPSGLTPVKYLEQLGVLEAGPTLVHMVNVTEDDIRTVQRYGCSVVHCPRSNELLRCGRFPWETYARHAVNVAFGTDSRGSSPSLDVHQEVLYALELHGAAASPLAAVRAAVKGGHQVLGMTPPRFGRGDPVSALHVWSGHLQDTGRSSDAVD